MRRPAPWIVGVFACALGAGASARLAHATGAKATQQASMQAVVDLHRAHLAMASNPELEALRFHIDQHGPVKLSRMGNTVVVKSNHIAIEADGNLKRASVVQLVELGITTPKELRGLLDEAILRAVDPTQAFNRKNVTLARETLQQRTAGRIAMAKMLVDASTHPDVQLLNEYLGSQMYGSDAPKIARHLALFENSTTDTKLLLARQAQPELWVWWKRNTWRTRDLDELQNYTGATELADLDGMLRATLLKTAGVHGDPADPVAVEHARNEIRRQMPLAAEMRALVRNYRSHPRLAMGLDLAGAMSEDPLPPSFTFAHHNQLALVAGARRFGEDALVLVDSNGELAGWHTTVDDSHADTSATWHDLRRVNIQSRADLDAAVDKALAEQFPLHSLPLQR
jgi:hypothetical protein